MNEINEQLVFENLINFEEWGAIVVALGFIIYLIMYQREKSTWWELLLPLVISVSLMGLSGFLGRLSKTTDIEYWGNYVVKANYYEAYDEEVSCSHEIMCESTSTDSDGNTTTTSYVCGYEHSYDVNNVSSKFEMVLNDRRVMSISEKEYLSLKEKFGNATFVELNRKNIHSKDGDLYESKYDGTYNAFSFIATEKRYINKVRNSEQFHYQEVSPEEIKENGLYVYPEIVDYKLPCILSDSSYVVSKEIQERYDYLNGRLGMKKEVRLWVLIYKNKSEKSGRLQEELFQGGNQNEIVVMIGINDKEEVSWSRVVSFTDKTDLLMRIEEHVEGKKIDLVELSLFLYKEIDKNFVRKPFEEFGKLTIAPPLWAVILSYVLTLLSCSFISLWIVNNEYENENEKDKVLLFLSGLWLAFIALLQPIIILVKKPVEK